MMRPSALVALLLLSSVLPVRVTRLAEAARARLDREIAAVGELEATATRGGGRRLAWARARMARARVTATRRAKAAAEAMPRYVDYADRNREYGGHFDTAFKGAIRRAGLNPKFTPHTLRHTWATWHYAIHKDPLKLKQDGCWSSLKLVERYAHLMPAGHDDEIRAFYAGSGHDTDTMIERNGASHSDQLAFSL
jgi:integrase